MDVVDLISDDEEEQNEPKETQQQARIETKSDRLPADGSVRKASNIRSGQKTRGSAAKAKESRLVMPSSSSSSEESTSSSSSDDEDQEGNDESRADLASRMLSVTRSSELTLPKSESTAAPLSNNRPRISETDDIDNDGETCETASTAEECATICNEDEDPDLEFIEKENEVVTQSYDFDEVLDDLDYSPGDVSTGVPNSSFSAVPTITFDLSKEDDDELDDETRLIVMERDRITTELKSLDVDERKLDEELMLIQTMIANIHSRKDALKRELAALRMDGSKDKTWSSESFPHSKILRSELSRIFRFEKFRELQLEVMNATICGRDCFVVLPTGSGKSLLFQLPSVIQGGITVVISPLLSLSRDQLLNLADKGISGLMISSEQDREELKRSYSRLFNADPSLRLVYVTPEMMVQSKKFVSVLEALYRKRLLTRIVVDEAHCCSTMGHDFRPDYQKLFFLKRQFPSVPLLCVTATATIQVEEDVKRVLLGECEEDWLVFRASFNRVNLHYEVVEKKGDGNAFDAQLCQLVNQRFAKQCGIVYCLSRKDAEDAAKALKQSGCSARPYHAKLNPARNRETHELWRTGAVKVVCATTAFGMGIDKPDVRFVIHATMSTSIEGYAQESGRAGRDGKEATCVLLYRRADVSRVSQLISDKQTGTAKLFEMVRYSENCSECRRVVMGRCFGEVFDPAKCNQSCDVCKDTDPAVKVNHTLQAENVLRMFLNYRATTGSYLTMAQLVDAWRGTGSHSSIGGRFHSPSGWSRSDCERLVLHMLLSHVLKIHWTYNAHRTTAYLDQGEKAHILLRQFNPDQIRIEYHVKAGSKKSRKSIGETDGEAQTKSEKASNSAKKIANKRKAASTPKLSTSASNETGVKTTLTDMFRRQQSRSVEPIKIELDRDDDTTVLSTQLTRTEEEEDIWDTPSVRKTNIGAKHSIATIPKPVSLGLSNSSNQKSSSMLFSAAPIPASGESLLARVGAATSTSAKRQQIAGPLGSSSGVSLVTSHTTGNNKPAPTDVLTAVARLPSSYMLPGSLLNQSGSRQGSFHDYAEPEEEEFDPDAYYGQ